MLRKGFPHFVILPRRLSQYGGVLSQNGVSVITRCRACHVCALMANASTFLLGWARHSATYRDGPRSKAIESLSETFSAVTSVCPFFVLCSRVSSDSLVNCTRFFFFFPPSIGASENPGGRLFRVCSVPRKYRARRRRIHYADDRQAFLRTISALK